MALIDDWNEAVSEFNDAGYKLNVITGIWNILDLGQKQAIKTNVLNVLTSTKTKINALETQINGL